MLDSLVKKMYLFSQLSEPSLDEGEALTYLGQARLQYQLQFDERRVDLFSFTSQKWL